MTDRNSVSAIIADFWSGYVFSERDDAMRRHLHRRLAHDDAGAPLADTIWAALLVINVAEALGCARPLADDLIRERVLAQVAMDALSALGRPHKPVPEAAVHALLDRFRAAAAPVDHAEPGMVPIAKAAEKARVRAIDIVHLILGGCLRRVQRLRALDGIAGLLVDPAEVRAAAARTLVGISAAEAFGILKMPPASVWALVHAPEEETAIPAISVEGENASCRFHRFRREDLEAFEAVFTTVPRLAEQTWHEFKLDEIGRCLNFAGVKPVLRKRDLGIQLYRIADLPAAFRAPSSSPPTRSEVKE